MSSNIIGATHCQQPQNTYHPPVFGGEFFCTRVAAGLARQTAKRAVGTPRSPWDLVWWQIGGVDPGEAYRARDSLVAGLGCDGTLSAQIQLPPALMPLVR